MNKNSLQIELNKLKLYLKDLSKKPKMSEIDLTIHSYTLTGMIEHIYSLISTGAYTPVDNSLDEIFNLIELARNTALHYHKAKDFDVTLKNVKEIVNATPTEFSSTIVSKLTNYINNYSYPNHLLVHNSDALKISDGSDVIADSILFENIRTKESVYIPKNNVVILENKLTGDVSYLVKFSNEKDTYYKKDKEPTILTSTYGLYSQKFFASGYIKKEKIIDLDKVIKKIIDASLKNPYNSLLLTHTHGHSHYSLHAYNVLDEYIRTNILDENIAFSKFTIKEQELNLDAKHIDDELPYNYEKPMLENASLKDLLYIETFLKDYNTFKNSLREANENNIDVNNYAKHAYLLELYKRGPSNLSEQFIKTYPEFASFFYEYRALRNTLAHTPITNEKEKEVLINNLEKYNERLFEILNNVYHVYSKDKRKYPYSYLKNGIQIQDTRIFSNKTDVFNIYKHTGETVVIGGVKYLRLFDRDHPNYYIQVDGAIYVYNYTTESSYECIVPKNFARIVEIDKNGIVKKTNHNPVSVRGPIMFDTNQNALLQAYNYLQHFPQAESKKFSKAYNIKSLPIITVYDAMGPAYNEPLKHVLHRKFNQKFLPRELLGACKCKLYDDIDKPIEILDKDNNIIATIYYGNIKKNGTITQVSKDGIELEIPHGAKTLRATDTSTIINEIKLERNKR